MFFLSSFAPLRKCSATTITILPSLCCFIMYTTSIVWDVFVLSRIHPTQFESSRQSTAFMTHSLCCVRTRIVVEVHFVGFELEIALCGYPFAQTRAQKPNEPDQRGRQPHKESEEERKSVRAKKNSSKESSERKKAEKNGWNEKVRKKSQLQQRPCVPAWALEIHYHK